MVAKREYVNRMNRLRRHVHILIDQKLAPQYRESAREMAKVATGPILVAMSARMRAMPDWPRGAK